MKKTNNTKSLREYIAPQTILHRVAITNILAGSSTGGDPGTARARQGLFLEMEDFDSEWATIPSENETILSE